MPSSPNAASPFLPERLQAEFGQREPGTPSTAGQPGVQAANLSFPNPPAPASAVAGRPPNSTGPAQAGAPAPAQQPVVPQSPVPEQKPSGDAGATAKAMGLPAESLMQNKQAQAMAHQEAVVRKREELGALPAVFNHPSLPKLPIELGRSNYNPMTNRWG